MIPEESEQSGSSPPWRRALELTVSVVVVGAVVFFLGRVLYNNWSELQQYNWQISLPRLGLSYVALVISYLIDISAWWYTINRMGQPLPYYPQALRLYFGAGLGKYLPGSVWQFVGWFYLAQREGVSKVAAGTSVLLTQAISALVGTLLAIAAFAAKGGQDVIRQLLPLLLILPITIIFLQPRIISRLLNFGLRILRRSPISFDLTTRQLATIFFVYFCGYGLWGTALFIFANSLTHIPLSDFIPFLGVFPAAYAVGLLAPFAPAGIGVREAALTYLLSFFVPLPVATVIALLTRPWLVAVDIVGGGLAVISYARQRASAAQQEQREET